MSSGHQSRSMPPSSSPTVSDDRGSSESYLNSETQRCIIRRLGQRGSRGNVVPIWRRAAQPVVCTEACRRRSRPWVAAVILDLSRSNPRISRRPLSNDGLLAMGIGSCLALLPLCRLPMMASLVVIEILPGVTAGGSEYNHDTLPNA
jgi:hypothetical protein